MLLAILFQKHERPIQTTDSHNFAQTQLYYFFLYVCIYLFKLRYCYYFFLISSQLLQFFPLCLFSYSLYFLFSFGLFHSHSPTPAAAFNLVSLENSTDLLASKTDLLFHFETIDQSLFSPPAPILSPSFSLFSGPFLLSTALPLFGRCLQRQ